MKKIIIVGAGISGLYFANLLEINGKYDYKIIEVPVIFTDRTLGSSKMSGGIFFEAFFGVIQMKLKSFFKNWSR